MGEIANRDARQQGETHGVQIGRTQGFADSQAETGIAAGLYRCGVEAGDSLVVDADQGIGDRRQPHAAAVEDLLGAYTQVFQGLGNRDCIGADDR
ncbi:hypothetical protein D9M70_621200 [compost metagenome]